MSGCFDSEPKYVNDDYPCQTITLPKYVGAYEIGYDYTFQFAFTKKPMWLHRFFMNVLLGFKWRDY